MPAFVALALFWVLFDQATKYYVQQNMALYESHDILGGWMAWTYVHNTGGAFSLLQGQRWFFVLVALVFCAGAFYYLYKEKPGKGSTLSLALLVGGAIGNLIDRVRWGYVVDFIDWKVWPVFNIADIGITMGAALLILFSLYEKDTENSPSKG